MTSEVVVMNRTGVAMAADSAVTVETADNTKVRNSGLKLFRLSKQRPVGVMVYNNASLLGVPMETIIKMFRRRLGKKSYPKLVDYGEDLIGYLDRNETLFPEALQDLYFLRAVETEYRRVHLKFEEELLARNLSRDSDETAVVVAKVIAKRLKCWRNRKQADYEIKDVRAKAVMGRIAEDLQRVLSDLFRYWPVDNVGMEMLREIPYHLLEKDKYPPDVLSGLVIAGFGENEHFPVVQHIEIGGVYDGHLKYRRHDPTAVSETQPVIIQPFAYTNMAKLFLSGLSESGWWHMDNAEAYIRNIGALTVETIPELDGEKRKIAIEAARQNGADLADNFSRSVRRHAERRLARIVDTVNTLTIKELAGVASTLVGLSSFEKQMSLESETVGGPVDVAVISKGDGFIWIDRKHYFSEELNEHFVRNYYDD